MLIDLGGGRYRDTETGQEVWPGWSPGGENAPGPGNMLSPGYSASGDPNLADPQQPNPYQPTNGPAGPMEDPDNTPQPNPVTPPPAPPGSSGQPGPTGTTTTTMNPYEQGGGFTWPTYTAPQFQAPPPFSYADYQDVEPFSYDPYQGPSPFSYDAFSAPTKEQAAEEPGYQFSADEGRKRLETSAAAKGILRTGGTLKDILGWGNQFAEQNYGNVFNRNLQTYTTNRGNAFDTWGANELGRAQTYDRNRSGAFDAWGANRNNKFTAWTANRNNAADSYSTNYGVSRDVFDRTRQGSLDEFQPKQRTAELSFDDLYRRWRDLLNANTSVATAGAGA